MCVTVCFLQAAVWQWLSGGRYRGLASLEEVACPCSRLTGTITDRALTPACTSALGCRFYSWEYTKIYTRMHLPGRSDGQLPSLVCFHFFFDRTGPQFTTDPDQIQTIPDHIQLDPEQIHNRPRTDLYPDQILNSADIVQNKFKGWIIQPLYRPTIVRCPLSNSILKDEHLWPEPE